MPNPRLTYYNLSEDGETPIELESEDDISHGPHWLVGLESVPKVDPKYVVHTYFLGYDGDRSPWLKGQKRSPKCFRTRVVALDDLGEETGDVTEIHNETREAAESQHKYGVQWCKKMVENALGK